MRLKFMDEESDTKSFLIPEMAIIELVEYIFLD